MGVRGFFLQMCLICIFKIRIKREFRYVPWCQHPLHRLQDIKREGHITICTPLLLES